MEQQVVMPKAVEADWAKKEFSVWFNPGVPVKSTFPTHVQRVTKRWETLDFGSEALGSSRQNWAGVLNREVGGGVTTCRGAFRVTGEKLQTFHPLDWTNICCIRNYSLAFISTACLVLSYFWIQKTTLKCPPDQNGSQSSEFPSLFSSLKMIYEK